MYSKNWLVIRDDARRKFEVCGKESNIDPFMNKIFAMQRAGMSISGVTPPVTNRTASKSMIKFTGFELEEGLYEQSLLELQKRTRGNITEFDVDMEG